MKFKTDLIEGCLIRRYKRFLVDVALNSGEIITAHTANTGKMLGCSAPGSRIWLSNSSNIKRKYQHTWELVEVQEGAQSMLVGINTQLSNALVCELITNNPPAELGLFDNLRREVPYGEHNSRVDILLENNGDKTRHKPLQPLSYCYIEVKNVTLVDKGIAYFPDAVTSRGVKHLQELATMVARGHRAVIFFCVQRTNINAVSPADWIDPLYGSTLRSVMTQGVEAMAYAATVNCQEVVLNQRIPVIV